MKLKKISNKRPHDLFCFACGKKNHSGLKLKYKSINSGKVSTSFKPASKFQSHENTLHGGMQALILDACMLQAVKSIGFNCVTGKMETRYKHQVFLKNKININAIVTRTQGNFIFVTSEIIQDKHKVTTATGIYKKVNK